MATCRNTGSLFFLDKDLRKITRTIHTDTTLHDASPFRGNKIIAYKNYPNIGKRSSNQRSAIVLYDKTSEKKEILYGEKGNFFSDARGSVQSLNEYQLFISHSQTNEKPYVELINLKSGFSKKIFLKTVSDNYIQTARLNDYSSFLKMNII